jgi:hypothetical protein
MIKNFYIESAYSLCSEFAKANAICDKAGLQGLICNFCPLEKKWLERCFISSEQALKDIEPFFTKEELEEIEKKMK